MKKIININLSGRVIPIEDAAYESLQRYIESLRRYFANEDGRDEIINDIESRIAELMNDKVRKGAPAITEDDMNEIITSMGRVEDFEQADAAETTSSTAGEQQSAGTSAGPNFSYARQSRGRLYRDANDKLLGGVCSGIASYLNFDPAIVRLLFAILTFGAFGTGFLLYIILWIVLPVRSLETFEGKRLFRNPDDKVISGVAGGLAAYFDKPASMIRLIFAAPLVLNIIFGVLNGIFFFTDRNIFPNLFIGSFTGTFCLAYIILWIVLPEASSPFEKMEMRGEKVDVNRIRQNVQEGMSDFKTKMESWGEEVKTSAQQFSTRATNFAQTRGKTFAGEVAATAQPVARGVGHVIGVLFKAFFIFIAGSIALGLFAALMVIIFGGVAFWPINEFLFTSSLQKVLAWGTLLFFIGVPIVGFMIWLVRRVGRVRSRNRYLGWTFGGLWTIGWICAISLAVSVAKDLRFYEKGQTIDVPVAAGISKLTVNVNEPPVRYSGSSWWADNNDDQKGWDIVGDTMKYTNVKVRVDKSEDSNYHVVIYKYTAGQSRPEVQRRAEKAGFLVALQDSTLNLGSGVTIDKASKFRMQGVIVEIKVPVGKKIRFDESIIDAYDPWVVRRSDDYRGWSRRHRYEVDWDNDDYFNWDADVDYVMTSEGQLKKPEDVVIDQQGVRERKPSSDSLRQAIEERERQLEEDRNRLRDLEREQRNNNNRRDTGTTTGVRTGKEESLAMMPTLFNLLII